MKLNVMPLLAHARHITTVGVSPVMDVTVIDDVVDAVTGEPAMLAAERLRGLNVWEAASFLHDTYAGDTAFVIRTPAAFAVVRPPFSELPVFYWERRGRVDVWSGLGAPTCLRECPPNFDLDYLAGRLLNWSWVTPATGLRGVRELLSGAVLIFDGRELYQRDRLAETVAKLPLEPTCSYDEQVEVVRALISNSVRHKIGPYLDRTSILCSGGVDSSVLAVAVAALYPKRTLPLIHCYSDHHLHGDERFYFNAVVDQVGAPASMVDMQAGSSRNDLSPQLLAPGVRPTKSAAALPTVASMYGLAKANGSSIVLTGDGGDQLFLLNHPILYSREIATEAGTFRERLHSLIELSIMGRSTFWGIAGEVLCARRAKRFLRNYFGAARFRENPVAQRIVPVATELVPNGDELTAIGASRVFQYFGMRNAELNRVRLKDYAIDERKAFVFWPLIRASIMAKRRHHLNGGCDRALERDAFRAELPEAIYYRVRKGAGQDFVDRYDYQMLIETILKSPVVKHGLVSEQIKSIAIDKIDHETAFALVAARGIADWMEFYD